MKSIWIAAVLAGLALSSCQHIYDQSETTALADASAAEQFAIDTVYDQRPTRALVDTVETLSMDGEVTIVRIEMTGAPTARQIYKVTVSEAGDGSLQLAEFEILQ